MKSLNNYILLKNQYIDLMNQIGGKKEQTYIDIITSHDTKRLSIDNLKTITSKFNTNLFGIKELLCLDFHGVADLYDLNEYIPSKLPKCVI
jgi:hypothetical protein